MKLLALTCIAAFGAAVPGHTIQQKIRSLSLNPNAKEAPAQTLQGFLDGFCEGQYKQLCKESFKDFCTVSKPLARKDVGKKSQNIAAWRCYSPETLDMKLTKEVCVDDCGNMTQCSGAISGFSNFHASSPELDTLIEESKNRFCKPDDDSQPESLPEDSSTPESTENATTKESLQGFLDEVCESKFEQLCKEVLDKTFCIKEKPLARKDVGRDTQNFAAWRCYAPSDLDMKLTKEVCVDDCGNITQCSGAVADFSINHTTVEFETLIEETKKRFCKENGSDNNLQPIPDHSPGTELLDAPISALQKVIDGYCIRRFAVACMKNKHFCSTPVARHGVVPDEGVAWRCYSKSALDYGKKAVECVDSCGNIDECHGAVMPEMAREHISAPEDLTKIIDELRSGVCLMK